MFILLFIIRCSSNGLSNFDILYNFIFFFHLCILNPIIFHKVFLAFAIALDSNANIFVTGASIRTGTFEDYCTIKYSQSVGVNLITSELPGSYLLLQNYPNPFNPVTRITYQITNTGRVSLKIFDIRGNELEELVNETHYPGTYSVDWEASAYSSGVYFYRLVSGNFSQSRKMNLVK